MIRTIDIRLNAAHPELPLPEATTYQGAPSTAFLRGVPKACGQWQITAVSVAVTFPDNSTTTRAAVLSAGDVWVVTIPACATSGRTTSGLRILADGTDENGDAVTGYVLGVADFAVATFDIAPAPGVTSYALRYFDNVPNPPHKGDVATVDGALKYYDGAAWQPFAAVPSPSTSAPQMDGTASAGSSAAYARGDHVHPTDTTRASTADATLAERGFTEWTCEPATNPYTGVAYEVRWWDAGFNPPGWYLFAGGEYPVATVSSPDYNATTIDFDSCVATRTALPGYVLGSQTDKPLASEAEAEELRTGKQDALSTQQLANIAAVPGKLDKSGGGWNVSQTEDGLRIADDAGVYYIDISPGGVKTNYPDTDHVVLWPINSGTLALAADLQYALTAKAIDSGAVTLDDRAINAVAVSSSLASLTINFPTATSGKARDFGLRLTVASGITTAPQIVIPQGVTCENVDGTAPEIGADGKTTILYFTETAAGVFLVKGEVVTAIS